MNACHRLSYLSTSLYSDASSAVPCTKPHTAFTFAVPTLPASVIVKGVDIGNKTIQDAASAACQSAFDRFVGGVPETRALSRITVTYFLPDQAGFNLGAHWVRCDLIAMRTQQSLADLPANPRHFLDQARALDQYGACSQGDPGSAKFRLVMCSEPHTYRALAALRLGADGAKYPGETVTRVEGKRRCGHLVAAKLNLSGGYTYGWTYPTSANWAEGQRFGYCWNKTTK
ncbi:MAG: septum formation family protein [Nocardioidaceae bacterium]